MKSSECYYIAMKAVRTVFIGTSEEGASVLEALIADTLYEVTAAVTQPDRPVGRKQVLTPTPIKDIAVANKLKVYTPERNRKKYREIMELEKPELVVTISYGEFLPKSVLKYPKYKCINIHYSLLPKLRGAVPVQMAILKGFKKTGVTISIMEKGCDTGDILAQQEINLAGNETTVSLKEILIPMGKELLMNTLPKWVEGKIKPVPQPDCEECPCYRDDISKEKAQINWENMEPEYIERMIRAFLPWPVAWTVLPDGKRLKIFKANLLRTSLKKDPGEMIVTNEKLLFATKDSDIALDVQLLQPEGRNQMDAKAFIQGLR